MKSMTMRPPISRNLQLAGDLVSRLQICSKGGLLDVRALGGTGRVDIDTHQGLGVVDDQGSTGRQPDRVAEGGLDLAFYLVTGE